MTITQAVPLGGPVPGRNRRPIPLWAMAVAAVVVLAIAALVGYGIGTRRDAGTGVLVGRAYVSPVQAGVNVDGWAYGFAVSPNGMQWYDAQNGFHDGGIPPCMQHAPEYAWIRFGYSTARGLDGSSWRVVDWVQCVSVRP